MEKLYVVFFLRRTHQAVYERVLRNECGPACFDSLIGAIYHIEMNVQDSWAVIERVWPDRETRYYGREKTGLWATVCELPFDRPTDRTYNKGIGNHLDISVEEIRYVNAGTDS